MKKKTITLVVYMLVCISLVSVGFAAWIITGKDEAQAVGNISATTVTDKSLTISNHKWDGEDAVYDSQTKSFKGGSLIFGHPEENDSTAWLQFTNESNMTQKLTTTFGFTVSCDSEFVIKDLVKSATVAFDDSALDTAIAQGYIKDPIITVKAGETSITVDATNTLENVLFNALKTQNSDSVDVEIKIEYRWGFGNNQNPFDYYNDQAKGAIASSLVDGQPETRTYKEQAQDALEEIYRLNNQNFTLSVTVESTSAQ